MAKEGKRNAVKATDRLAEPEGSPDHEVERSRFLPKAKEGKRNAEKATDRLAEPEGSPDHEVERSRFLPKAKEGKRNALYYFHGFNSGIPADISTSPKIAAVADFCRASGRDFLPQNIDYRFADRHAREILDSISEEVEQVIFCGASMGGWFARVMQVLLANERPGLSIEAVIFNPAFNLAEFGHHLEGRQVNFVTGAEYDFTSEHSKVLIGLEASIDYRASLPLWVYVDSDDEVINAEWSRRWYEGFARFHAYPGGSHSFEHAREALEDYQAGC